MSHDDDRTGLLAAGSCGIEPATQSGAIQGVELDVHTAAVDGIALTGLAGNHSAAAAVLAFQRLSKASSEAVNNAGSTTHGKDLRDSR